MKSGKGGRTDWRARRKRSESAGRRAEALAAFMLQLKGYSILARRARTPYGEIDLIARRGRMLVFIEVKARKAYAPAIEAVTPGARKRIEQAARAWVTPRRDLQQQLWRFDIVAVTPRQWPRHIRDAWRAES
jgi:putative endonuclease